MLATHDLELVRLADANPHIANFHFREDVIDGQMVFDYKLRPGPCPTTNALKIMRVPGSDPLRRKISSALTIHSWG